MKFINDHITIFMLLALGLAIAAFVIALLNKKAIANTSCTTSPADALSADDVKVIKEKAGLAE